MTDKLKEIESRARSCVTVDDVAWLIERVRDLEADNDRLRKFVARTADLFLPILGPLFPDLGEEIRAVRAALPKEDHAR